MTTRARRALPWMGALLLAGSLTGCSLLPKAPVDATRYYVLSAPAADAAPQANAPVVQIRPIELASYLRGRPIIVRRGDNEIEFRDYARWGEPLEQGIGRILREGLLARGAAGSVVMAGGRRDRAVTPAYDVAVRVLAAEGSASGAVEFRATWEVSRTDAKTAPVAAGNFHPADLRWDGKTEASLAAQLSNAVAALSAEIAAALKK